MSEKIESFIQNVMDGMVIDEELRNRIREDLRSHISEASSNQSEEEVLDKMGSPAEVARDFMDSVYENKSEVIERLVRERLKVNQLMADYFEYRSKIQFWGVPLLHIKYRRNFNAKQGTAKGVVAIGNRAVGVVAIGKYCCGGICFGMFPLGFVAAGLISGGFVAFGSLAVGILAMGGFVFGMGAFGGFTYGLIAGGGFARGIVAMGGHMAGKYMAHTALGSAAQIKALVREAYPRISEWILNIIVFMKFWYS